MAFRKRSHHTGGRVKCGGNGRDVDGPQPTSKAWLNDLTSNRPHRLCPIFAGAACKVRTDGKSDLPRRRSPRQPEVKRPRARGRTVGLPHQLPAGDSDLIGCDSERDVDGAPTGWQVDTREPCPCAPNLYKRW